MKIRAGRVLLVAAALLSMTYGIWLGLLRVGWILPLPWPDQLILHGPLMIGGFVGTLIGLERAVALGRSWAFVAPLATASGAVLLVIGPPGPTGAILITIASAVVVVVFATFVRRQPATFLITMLAAAGSWLAGNLYWTFGAAIYRVVPWWIAFIVLTIAAERLELNRMRRPSPLAATVFVLTAALIFVAPFLSLASSRLGSMLLGVGLLAVSAWLFRNDIARRTVKQRGLPRYIAICLLVGYGWLAVAAFLLLDFRLLEPGPHYDAILHAVFVGFVVSMLFGHAPIVLPAVAGIALPIGSAGYLPLIVLHGSVALRLAGDLNDSFGRLRAWGALLNAIAILLFIATGAASIVHGANTYRRDHA